MRWRPLGLALIVAAACPAEVHPLSLREAIDRALAQNPELVLRRLEEQRLQQVVRQVRDPFAPKLYVGSGAAYTTGIPMSIGGNPPAAFQAQASQTFYNKPQTYAVAEARENARGAAIETASKRDEVAYRTASLYVDLDSTRRATAQLRQQINSFEAIAGVVQARVGEGRELPVEATRARVNLARLRQRIEVLAADEQYLAGQLASALGYGPGDTVEPAPQPVSVPDVPRQGDEVARQALENNKEVRRLESALLARGYAVRAGQTARLPQIELVAQYALLTRFNNFEDFYRRFQRNNVQLGLSFRLPVLPGAAASAGAAQAEIEAQKLRVQMNDLRSRITLDARRAASQLEVAESARELAKLDLDAAREQLSVLLAQNEEGRAGLRQVEEARAAENERWLGYYQALADVERAKLTIMRVTGVIQAALRP